MMSFSAAGLCKLGPITILASLQGSHRPHSVPYVIVKFLQNKQKYCERRAKISADNSVRLFRVMCNKVSRIPIRIY